ncbi:MAG: type II toxin-antitoxin system VapC family toxin [Actinobacteria bacterium]|nr:type II toxin-antitoxin system VapC family toxin [Actinomycetota bacterium]
MIVVDASAVIEGITSLLHPAVEVISDAGELHAPYLIDYEIDHALGRLERHRSLAAGVVDDARGLFAVLPLNRHAHRHVAERAWDLRRNLSIYDASYVALAERLGVPLLTADRRLATAPGHNAEVIVVEAPS